MNEKRSVARYFRIDAYKAIAYLDSLELVSFLALIKRHVFSADPMRMFATEVP